MTTFNRPRFLLACLAASSPAAAFTLNACGDNGDPADTSVADADVAPPDSAEVDTSVDSETSPDATDATDASETTVATDTRPAEVIVATRDFQEACTQNAECLSGYCVPSGDGNVCTRGCSAGCPAGWGCGRVLNVTTDQVEVCLDRATTLCHPCAEDDDCNLFTGGGLNRCLDLQLPDGAGSGGRFCGIACDDTNTCPDGFSCISDQCRPDAAACDCNPLAVALELVTVCSAANPDGTCAGTRACGAEGLSGCTAPAAVAETCNSLDDDCDGRTDEDLAAGGTCDIVNTFGTCPGTSYCISGQAECLGTAAVAEICDGNDQNCDGAVDEGFPDFDGDGIADCQDPDDDDDGTPDLDDCAPTDASRHAAATEVCGNDIDDDCDGMKEEEGAQGCTSYNQDVDGDTFGSPTAPARCLCAPDPTTYYTVVGTTDCNDLDEAIRPGGTEVCNLVDDTCEGNTDEGVSAPCGGCVNICLLEAGPTGATPFALADATNLVLDGGALELAPGQTSGTYRQRWAGWPQDGTDWDILFLEVTHPSPATSVSVRWRTAATAPALAGAAFTPFSGPFPPQTFPLYLETLGNHVEIELRLDTSDVAQTPSVRGVSVLAAQN